MTFGSTRYLGNLNSGLRSFFHPVAFSSDIQDRPVRARLMGQDWVLYRFDGEIQAFLDRCPHRSAPLSVGSVFADGIECLYHGWRFSAEGRCTYIPALGDSQAIPKNASLTCAAKVEERYGLVFLAPDTPKVPLLEIAQDKDAQYERGELPMIVAGQHAGYLADNFLDMAHFPFVHSKTFGDALSVRVAPYNVQESDVGFSAFYSHKFLNREDPGVGIGKRNLEQRRDMTYNYAVPFSMSLELSFVETGGTMVIGFFISPVEECVSQLYTLIWRNDLGFGTLSMQEAIDFELEVLREDLWLQEKYNTPGFALDPRLEAHTAADRITLAMRRSLRRYID